MALFFRVTKRSSRSGVGRSCGGTNHSLSLLSSPDLDFCRCDELPVIATDDQGMIVDDEIISGPTATSTSNIKNVEKQVKERKKREPNLYISRHFTPTPPTEESNKSTRRRPPRKRRKNNTVEERFTDLSREAPSFVTQANGIVERPSLENSLHPSTPENGTARKKKETITNSQRRTEPAKTSPSSNELKNKGEAVQNEKRPPKRRRKSRKERHAAEVHYNVSNLKEALPRKLTPSTTEVLTSRLVQRVFYGLNVDALSSDSDLTDLPDDIGPDPFITRQPELVAVRERKKKPQKRNPTKSPYFPIPHKHRSTFLSTLPFPPLDHERFGLMQESLFNQPFRLLLATIFLNKTPGARAMPILYRLLSIYPTPEALAEAKVEDITTVIWELGFQNQRARKCVGLAKGWLERPPEMGKKYRKKDYPAKTDGRNLKDGEVYEDERDGGPSNGAWEISHLPGLGPYSHDSWRIFCRDRLRGLAESWDGEGHILTEGESDTFEPEWKRVLPTDKELRAYLTWMWLKKGWVWNKDTGVRTRASEELMRLAHGDGNVVIEDREREILMIKPLEATNDGEAVKIESNHDNPSSRTSRVGIRVEKPAGDFMPA